MSIDTIQNSELYHWLLLNPQWIAVSVLVVAFVESFAIVGVVVPGVFLLYVAAFLAGTGLLDLPTCLLMAFLGAVTGDGCSYFIGRFFKDSLRGWPVIRDNLAWMDRGERFIEQYGMMSIVIGRFLGPIRPIMPLVAGSLAMPARRFFTINALSAIAWAPAYIVPGFALGAAMDMPFTTAQLSGFVLLGLLVLGSAYYLIRRWFNSNNTATTRLDK